MLLRRLPRRALLSVSGADARCMLDALLSCAVSDVRILGDSLCSAGGDKKGCVYGGLLTETGRVFYDLFVHGGTPLIARETGADDGVIVECSARAKQHLATMLRRRVMHADVVIKDVPETKLAVAATFAADAVHDLAANNEELEAAGLCRDPRVPLAAGRGIVPTHHVDHAESFLDGGGYRAWRYAVGLPCGPLEMRPGVLTALAVNFDVHGPQVLRDPTQHTYPGHDAVQAEIAREMVSQESFLNSKRVVPVRLEGEGAMGALGGDELVIKRGEHAGPNLVGRLIAAEDGKGLALMRVADALRASKEGADPIQSAIGAKEQWSPADPSVQYDVRPLMPPWWPRGPRPSGGAPRRAP